MSRPQLDIPTNMRPTYFASAFHDYDLHGLPESYKSSTTYYIEHNNQKYPPPAVAALAIKHCTGKLPAPGFRAGEKQTALK